MYILVTLWRVILPANGLFKNQDLRSYLKKFIFLTNLYT